MRIPEVAEEAAVKMETSRKDFLRWSALIAAGITLPGLAACGGAGSQSSNQFPAEPISLIVPVGTGGGSDQFTRAVAEAAERQSDAEFVVENRPGGSGNVAQNYVMQQDADGYTVYQAAANSQGRWLQGQAAVTEDDIVPVAKGPVSADMWVIRPDDERFSNFDELASYSRENPDNPLSIGVVYTTGYDPAWIEPVAEEAGIELDLVPFSEPSERYSSLLGGSLDIVFDQQSDMITYLESQQVKPVLVYSEEPIEGYEEVPTTFSIGVELSSNHWRGFFVKAGTPQDRVDRLASLFVDAMEDEQFVNDYIEDRENNLAAPAGREGFEEALQETRELFEESG